MLGYVLVSAADEGRPWRSLGAALKPISTVENLSRVSAKAGHWGRQKIIDAALNVRCEWARISLAETVLCLSDVIEIVGQRFTIWPIATELKGFGGKGSFSKKRVTNPYSNDAQSSGWRGKGDWSVTPWQQAPRNLLLEYKV